MAISPEAARARAALGYATVHGTPEDITKARAELRAAVLADRIRKAVEAAPSFTPEQCAELAAILRPAVQRGSDNDAA